MDARRQRRARLLGSGGAAALASLRRADAAAASCKVEATLGCFSFGSLADAAALGLPALGNVRQELLTHESCALACWRLGLSFSAVSGTQCLCGPGLGPEAAKARVSDDKCAGACPADKTQDCGSAGFLRAHQATCSGELAPNFHGCLDEASRALPYCNRYMPVDKRLDDLMSRLSLAEKLAQITPQRDLGDACTCITKGKADIGLSPWLWLVETNTNIASGCIQEGHCATTFIGPMGLGASFNRTLWRLKGSVFGTEMRALSNIGASRFRPDGKNPIGLTGFGPNINIVRDPRFGRNSELPGEDPLLSGSYAFEMVSGMQERDYPNGYPKMAAFLKHFTAYSVEEHRGHDTYDISTYDFFDTYLRQYKLAFEAQPRGVMCSYNAENGHPSCANDWLLNKQLRSWSPDAFVTTDCGAVSNLRGAPVFAADDTTAAAMTLMNGTDLEMGSTLFSQLDQALTRGLATPARVEEAVRRSFKVQFELGRFDPPGDSEWSKIGFEALNSSLHQQVSYEAALQGLVLLKNERAALPFKPGQTVAVVGPQGVTRGGLLSDYAADQWCFGGDDHCIGTIAEGLAAANAGGRVLAEQGVEVNSQRTDGIAAALEAAKQADVVVLALGIDRPIEHEGIDRQDTALPGLQESFAKQVLALGKPTVLLLTSGGALAIDGLVSRAEDAPYAIVEAFNPAVVGGRAIGATFFGLENRWGKLPVTMYPHSYIQEQPMTNFDMSKGPGRTYRYYQGAPLFPFGHGLSLTTWTLTCLHQARNLADTSRLKMKVECEVANTGDRDGDEVLQVYHRAVEIGKVDHPLARRTLVDFARVSVPRRSSRAVVFDITEETLKVVNAKGEPTLYPGKHEIIISRGPLFPEESVEVDVGPEMVIVV